MGKENFYSLAISNPPVPASLLVMKKVIVVSGANLFTGGPLTIIQEALAYLDAHLAQEYNIVALVHNKQDFQHLLHVEIIEIPAVRKSYLHRFYYEYYRYKALSKRLKPYLWFSLNDISSAVSAERQAVYCHNPAPFHKLTLSDIADEPTLFVFTLFYKLIYRINIHRNRYIIVQQKWIREWFVRMLHIAPQKIIVAPPAASPPESPVKTAASKDAFKTIFFFPARPRPFKNIEVIGEAVLKIPPELSSRYEVLITITGNENGYAQRMVKRYGQSSNIRFTGFLTRDEVFNLYAQTDCLLFPSRLETWGLPISEFKAYEKPMLVADRPYAHETVSSYDKAVFFPENDSTQLAKLMQGVMEGTIRYSKTAATEYAPPVAYSWEGLFTLLLAQDKAPV